MAKSKKTNANGGPLRLVYLLLLFLFGLVVWSFWQGARKDYQPLSVAFDNHLLDVLVAHGIQNEDLVSQSRREKSKGASCWIEYYKEVRLPAQMNSDRMINSIKAAAQEHGLELISQKNQKNGIVVDIGMKNKVFSRLVFIRHADAGAAPAVRQPAALPSKTPAGRKRVAIVIDDIGYTRDISAYLDLGIPITFAILPREHHSKEIALELQKRKMPYILHQPMEPLGFPEDKGKNPGSAALLVNMKEQEIRDKFKINIEAVPGVIGVSNHMGSKFSEDKEKMRLLMTMIKERGLFYFDSYTTPKTQAAIAAKEVGLPEMENGMFVDVKDDPAFMKKQFDILLKRTNKRTQVVAIGHIQRKYLPGVLKDEIPRFKAAGIEFVYLTELVSGTGK